MRTVTFVKDRSDELISKIFVKTETREKSAYYEWSNVLNSAADTVCLVLENGINDDIAEALIHVNARKYVLVSELDEKKYQKLSESVIVRECPQIKGRYCLIDDKTLFFFGNENFGIKVIEPKAVSFVRNLFLKEFWINSTEEFIQKKVSCAECTFDVPPVFGNEKALLDESFDGITPVEKIIEHGTTVAFCDKISDFPTVEEIIIKNAALNRTFLETTTNDNILLYPSLPFPVLSDGENSYAMNFDVSEYRKLPEKGKGRLFGIQINGLPVLGNQYRFIHHEKIHNLLGKELLNTDGSALALSEKAEEKRAVSVDLRRANDLLKMDEETLEASLEKLDSHIFESAVYAEKMIFTIDLNLISHRFDRKADVYSEYDNETKRVQNTLAEIKDAAKRNGNKKVISAVDSCRPAFQTIAEYQTVANEISAMIASVNHYEDPSEIDEGLLDVKNTKKKIEIKEFVPHSFKADIPMYGTLYQKDDQYEYVLKDEADLSDAIKEMQHLKKIQYLLR